METLYVLVVVEGGQLLAKQENSCCPGLTPQIDQVFSALVEMKDGNRQTVNFQAIKWQERGGVRDHIWLEVKVVN